VRNVPLISAARDIQPAALHGSVWQNGAQLALRFTRSAVMLWHHRSNSTANTAVSQNASWCWSYQSIPCEIPFINTETKTSELATVRIPDSCRNRWKEEERHCHYIKSLYRCLSKWQATFFFRILHWPMN